MHYINSCFSIHFSIQYVLKKKEEKWGNSQSDSVESRLSTTYNYIVKNGFQNRTAMLVIARLPVLEDCSDY